MLVHPPLRQFILAAFYLIVQTLNNFDHGKAFESW